MNFTQTAQWAFATSEATKRTVFSIVMDGLTHYDEDEINKLSPVLTDSQLQEICDTLVQSGEYYHEKKLASEKEKSPELAKYYENASRAMYHYATLWAISKPVA